mgnify:FL=1
MRTDDLIQLLAQGAGAAPRGLVQRRLGAALLLGLAASVAGAYAWLGFVPRELFALPGPGFKLGYAAAMALAAGWLSMRLARPAARVEMAASATAGVLLLAVVVGWLAWRATPPDVRVGALLGHSWALCPWFVLALSLPALAALLWALRGLAPTRPRAAGFAAPSGSHTWP